MVCMRMCRYLRQIAVITPYAEFKFTYAAEDDKSSMKTTFARRTDKMPASPKVRNGQIEPYLLSGQHFNQHTNGLISRLTRACREACCQLRPVIKRALA